MFDNLNNPLVPDGTPNSAATPAAPVSTEPVAPATPSVPSVDAERQKAELEAKIAKYENDIRAIKSTSDKRFNDAERNWQVQQEQMRKELQALRMATMDEDERKQYEASLTVERQQEVEQELQKARQTAADYQANLNAMQYFLSQGVPADKLVFDQGYDTLFNSGMEWLTNEVKRLRTAPASPQPPSSSQPANGLPTPPQVATASQGVPSTKPSWDDLRKKYGNDEQIYRLVESGLLPADIIPAG
jgi:hypothetical protein